MKRAVDGEVDFVPLCGPGFSCGNILWTFGIVGGGLLTGGAEVEFHLESGKHVKQTHIPRRLFSYFLLERAKMLGIDTSQE